MCHDAQTAGKSPISYMNKSSALLLALVLLSGCQALAPASPDDSSTAEDVASTPEKPVVYGSFSQDTLYSLLSAELAGPKTKTKACN